MVQQRAAETPIANNMASKSSGTFSGLRLPSLLLLLVLLCVSPPRKVSAWVQKRPKHHPRDSALQLQARERNKSTSALASSSLSAPPPLPDQAQQSLWALATTSERRESSSSSSTTTSSPSKDEDDQQVEKYKSAYLDPELVKQTVAAVFSEDAAANQSGPIYLFDGICNFCDASVHLCFDLDTAETLRFAPLQSPTGRALLQHFGRHPDDTSSLLLVVDPETAHFGSDAVLQTAARLEGLPRPVRALARRSLEWVPRPVRGAAYRLVSHHRHALMGTADGPQCRVDLDYARFLDEVVLDAEDSYEYDSDNQ